jgi:hypothetical protein
MAEEMRRRSPELELSASQAFARVFSYPANAPANAELAGKAHRRPAPTTSFAFPR